MHAAIERITRQLTQLERFSVSHPKIIHENVDRQKVYPRALTNLSTCRVHRSRGTCTNQFILLYTSRLKSYYVSVDKFVCCVLPCKDSHQNVDHRSCVVFYRTDCDMMILVGRCIRNMILLRVLPCGSYSDNLSTDVTRGYKNDHVQSFCTVKHV